MTSIKLGIDIGSTTVKIALLDEKDEIIFSEYKRHFSNVRQTLHDLILETKEKIGDVTATVKITGSGGLTLAKSIEVSFLQEVVCVSNAISELLPSADVAIEIGGEDAKIIYLTGGLDQRMNGICAGGTGSFIDQMAALLQTDAEGLNDYAKNHDTIYPIAARCGVFAKTDIQPLINEGAKKENLAASIFQAVATQTISGLACGRPIKGNVAFLGGPLHFLPELKNRFVDILNLDDKTTLSHENSHLFAAIGAAISSKDDEAITLSSLEKRLENNFTSSYEISRLDALFNNEEEYTAFINRHNENKITYSDLSTYEGDIFLGIDCGSTTTKMVLIGENSELLYSFYSSNEGSPLQIVTKTIKEIYEALPENAKIVSSTVTGYGENLIKSAILVDNGEIETVCHYKAAAYFEPDVDFILDIGGQDMKCITINDGVIDNVLLNEACSAGCGSFIETFSTSLNYEITDFAKIALFAENPIDLGSRCTVFMNSRVKQAQKEGASVADISAGLSYSVIKNSLQKVIKINDPEKMGKKIVVQGGTFYNNSILRAFELIAQREAVRPDIAGLMGAFGAALIAKERFTKNYKTTLLSFDGLDNFSVTTKHSRCKICSNNCLLSVHKFNDERKLITGNRCERGLGIAKIKTDVPNIYDYKLDRLFNYYDNNEAEVARRGSIGIPRVLNMFENYPLWHTLFYKLGFNVVLSAPSSRKIFEKGMDSIPSESVCYPAKLVHGHCMDLIEKGIDTIFYPSVIYEIKETEVATNHYNCPIVISYPENIKNNIDEINNINFINPFFDLNDKKSMIKLLCEAFPNIPKTEISVALYEAFEAQKQYKFDVRVEGERIMDYLKETGNRAFVLAGRPYHIDPEINHGIPELITSYGVAVLSEDSISHLGEEAKHNAVDQWAYHSRLYTCADYVNKNDNLELIQLNSFGCGIDAIDVDQVHEILKEKGKIHTVLKIDEVANLGSVKIRIRSLLAAIDQRGDSPIRKIKSGFEHKRVEFTKDMRKNHTILVPQMSPLHFNLLEPVFRGSGYNVVVLSGQDKESSETGLKYVNNDTCYPALIVVGEIVNAIKSGKYDTDNLSVVISQTGGSCRATNYISLIRRALAAAGYEKIPVISVSASGIEKNSGFKITIPILRKAIMALVFGDIFMNVLYKTRPYEKVPGSADALYKKWNKICRQYLHNSKGMDYKSIVHGIVSDFDKLPITDEKKPKVGIVGEILVKFHPTANNSIVKMLEAEGAEVTSPDLLGFFLYSFYSPVYRYLKLGGSFRQSIVMKTAISLVEYYREPMRQALLDSKRFHAPMKIDELIALAEPIVSTGNQSGEGWFLTAEMIELINNGVDNIICMQPFACLPNHVTGKGVIKKLREIYPLSNIVAIDYDPGASEVNQVNRIKLMLTTAEKNLEQRKEH